MQIEITEFPIPPPQVPSDVDRLRARLDELVGNIGDEFPAAMVARALLIKGTDLLLAEAGMMQAIWSGQRVVDLLAGRYTKDTTDLLIATPNC